MNRVNHTFSSIEQVTDQFLTTKNQKNLEKSSEISFAEILKEKQGLKFSKHAAMRFAKEKIRCNVICPGSITTDMAAGLTPDTMDMKMRGAMSAHSDLTLQPCSPLDVAKVALFLASDDAAPLTGQVVVSDYGVDL